VGNLNEIISLNGNPPSGDEDGDDEEWCRSRNKRSSSIHLLACSLRLLHAKSSRLLLSSPKEEREALGITDGLVRLSVGIEDVTDLLDDVRQGLERSARVESA
jgi:hypothetical protein